MKKRTLPLLLCMVAVIVTAVFLFIAPARATEELAPYVTDSTTTADDILTAWATGGYNYVKLGANMELTLEAGELTVDLAGNNLTVSGSGKVNAFDSANDTYDHLACGTLTLGELVTCEQVLIAPNGNRYIALNTNSGVTLHRMEMDIKTVSLRTNAAGLYYKAVYSCDKLMEEKVTAYGVVVSLVDIPGTDFKSVDSDAYTVVTGKFVSGSVVTSGSVVNILNGDLSESENAERSRMKLYANAYVDFGDGPIVADTANVGKKATDDGFTGVAVSLAQVMKTLDNVYPSADVAVQEQLDAFYSCWKTNGLSASYTNIGKNRAIDNSDLVFEEGTTNAYCPVCGETVSWMALDQTYVDSLTITDETDSAIMSGSLSESQHYYLASDITFDGTPVFGFYRGPDKGESSCLHLNGHNITATARRALYGNSGVMNVMGNGIVTGYSPNSTEGAAVQTANRNVNNGINIYGGTYKKTADCDATTPVVAFSGAGRAISIYDGVVVDGGTGAAIYANSSADRQKEGYLKLYNCTVNGDINMGELDTYATNVEIVGATINGTLTVPEGHTLSLAGKLDIDELILGADVKIATKGIDTDSTINIDADGIFTNSTGSAASYVDIFTPVDSYKKITVKNNALRCSKDYTSDLVFAEGTTDAYCPVCDATVTWTALTADAAVALAANSHYYLPDDITFTATADAYLVADGTTVKSCIHLNGHNLTATNARFLYGGSSENNVMGTGIVTGRVTDTYGLGSTIQVNNKNNKNLINLYSGTYCQSADASDDEYVINMQGIGGNVRIYEDAVIDANVSGKAIRIGSASGNKITVYAYGATIKGDIYMTGASSTYESALMLDDAVVEGTLDANGTNTITLVHAPKITLMDVEENSAVTMDRLMDGTDITVQNPGAFSVMNENAADYAKYFTAAYINDKIVAQDNVLTYKTNYTAKVQLDDNNQAYCPVCMTTVTWTAVSDDSAVITFTSGGHYYLTKDLNYTGEGTALLSSGNSGTKTCLHLNGHNVTATQIPAIFISSGYMNILGNGTVKGYNATSEKGSAVLTNNKNVNNGLSLYSGIYTVYDTTANDTVIGMQTAGGTLEVYEDAVIDGTGISRAINIGANSTRNSIVRLYDATVKGNVKFYGTGSESYTSSLESVNGTITGTLTVNGDNNITLTGRTKLGKLLVATGSVVGFENMLSGSSIPVSATGVFTSALVDPEDMLQYFTVLDDGKSLIVRDYCLYLGVKEEVPVAEQTDIDVLLAAYADRVVKYGDMHNHTDAGPTADGRFSLADFKERMKLLGMSFSTIVDHKQLAHMYHDDWISESTDDTDIVFVGGSEPAGSVTDGGSGSFHYNMLVNDPESLLGILRNTGKFTIRESTYAGFNWGSTDYAADGTQNKNGTYDPTQYSADPDGLLQTWNYPSFTLAEFRSLTASIYNAGGLLVHVHPKFSGYMDSDDPLDYFFGEDAGSADAVAAGIELHIPDNDNYMPSYEPNEEAYQTWVAILKAGKKCYGTYGNDNHRLPSADTMTTIYATENANSDEYMSYMHDGNFAPGWVGIRMQIGDASMGGTTDFTGQRVVFSIGDMYQNEHSAEYVYSATGEVLQGTWDSSYNPDNKYIVQVYDDGGLLMESEVDPGQMNYFAFDADPEAKYYRVVVWDMTQGYRCGVGNPIWNVQ